MRAKKIGVGLLAAGLAYAVAAPAQQYDRLYDQPYDQSGYGVATLEERVSRLEKRFSGNTFMEMSNRMEKLQSEVLKLRGTVEELANELEKARKQQRDMYSEFDRRLPAGTSPAAIPVTPLATPGSGAASEQPPAGTAPQPFPPPTPALVDPAARQAAYQKAFNALKEGKYPEAAKDFKSFIAAYPTGEYSDNAHYWLAEAYYVNRDFFAAKDTFGKVVQNFPQSGKVPDALLKLGFIEYENGRYAAAKEFLTDVTKRYPDSSAAKMAEKRLERMRQEKR